MLTELSDGTVLIRHYQDSDVDPLFQAVGESIPELREWMPWCHANYSLTDSAAWVLSRKKAWQDDEEYSFVISDVSTGTFIGGVGLNELRDAKQIANLGYWVRTGWTGRDIASRATILTAQYAFSELCLRRIEILAAIGNIASRRAAEKAGAQCEGLLRERIQQSEQVHDAVIYSILPQDLVKKPG
jgi:ribosomal-protein-serine acetyltransferase